MTSSTAPSARRSSFRIAPNFSNLNWQRLTLDPKDPKHADWSTAINVLRCRFEDRFILPIDKLIELGSDGKSGLQRFGFTVLAIDFLVLESLEGFRRGIVSHNSLSQELFTGFLKEWQPFKDALPMDSSEIDWAKMLYINGRCALHHSASTDGNVTVGVSGNVFKFTAPNRIWVNRTKFHNALKREFESYLEALAAEDQCELRRNFKTKMDAICSITPPSA